MYVYDPHRDQYRVVYTRPTISVIEKPAETYEQYHQRKKREENDGEPKKVPFGFARALVEGDE